MVFASCHPNLKNYGRGLCKNCFQRDWYRKNIVIQRQKAIERERRWKAGEAVPNDERLERKAGCHPERKHFAKGLCELCYCSQLHKRNRKLNPSLYLTRERRWRSKNQDKIKFYGIKHRFGINKDQYSQLLLNQKGKCGICKEILIFPHIDHDHQSNKIRGLLCGKCNRGIGMFKENIEFMKNAVQYIVSNK